MMWPICALLQLTLCFLVDGDGDLCLYLPPVFHSPSEPLSWYDHRPGILFTSVVCNLVFGFENFNEQVSIAIGLTFFFLQFRFWWTLRSSSSKFYLRSLNKSCRIGWSDNRVWITCISVIYSPLPCMFVHVEQRRKKGIFVNGGVLFS